MMAMKSRTTSGVARTTKSRFAAAVLLAFALGGAQASGQNSIPSHLGGTIGDYVWVEAGPGFGAWFVSGEWSLHVEGASCWACAPICGFYRIRATLPRPPGARTRTTSGS
jgi:hypothetical protein